MAELYIGFGTTAVILLLVCTYIDESIPLNVGIKCGVKLYLMFLLTFNNS